MGIEEEEGKGKRKRGREGNWNCGGPPGSPLQDSITHFPAAGSVFY